MAKLKVIITRRPKYQEGLYGVTVGHDSSGTANVELVGDEEALRTRLRDFGLSEGYADDVIDRLQTGHKSVTIEVRSKGKGEEH